MDIGYDRDLAQAIVAQSGDAGGPKVSAAGRIGRWDLPVSRLAPGPPESDAPLGGEFGDGLISGLVVAFTKMNELLTRYEKRPSRGGRKGLASC